MLIFYLGKELWHLRRFPEGEFSLNPAQLTLWSLFAVAAGLFLGAVFRHIGTTGPAAAISFVLVSAPDVLEQLLWT